ncbi:MAG: hypothetical protein H6672_03605 [Anaerolineaceae bacterium]|nr:hypothetical protein [Anaerolineaceae bacterium]
MMEIWIEGTPEQVIQVANEGLVDAIATNPSIMAQWTANGESLESVVARVCAAVDVPVFVQLHGPTVMDYLREMKSLRAISKQIQPKLVATHAGIAAGRQLAAQGAKPLITTIATVSQAFLAARAGAAYIAPYVGRIEDAGVDVYQLVADIATMYERHQVKTQIAAASVRSPEQAEKVLLAGAPILVMQHEVFMQLLDSGLSQNWMARFEENWEQIPHRLGQEK